MLAELAATAAAARGPVAAPEAAGSPDFAGLFKSALDQVGGAQEQASKLTEQLEKGAPGVALEDVMVSLAKANLSFQTMLAVRNKLVSAYQEITNMQV
jgi:flagellar hook-basal body complex protein FliE